MLCLLPGGSPFLNFTFPVHTTAFFPTPLSSFSSRWVRLTQVFMWAQGSRIKQITLLVFTGDWRRFPCWKPTEHEQASEHLQLARDIDRRNCVIVCILTVNVTFICVLILWWTCFDESVGKYFSRCNQLDCWYGSILIIECFDLNVLSVNSALSRTVSQFFVCFFFYCRIWTFLFMDFELLLLNFEHF